MENTELTNQQHKAIKSLFFEQFVCFVSTELCLSRHQLFSISNNVSNLSTIVTHLQLLF